MVDFIMDVHGTLYPDQEIPKSLYEKRTAVVENFKRLQQENEHVLKTFQDPKVHQQLGQNRDSKQIIDYLVQNHEFKVEMIDKCYEYAKCLYETGNYGDASKFLYIHRILVQPTDKNYLNGIWGKLASEILMQNWDTALEDLKRLQQFIDESTFGSSLQLLQQRTWLIHWSLFVFFNHPKGRDLIIELFLYQKQDLNVNFDFKGAQQKLRECETVLFNDFFLVACLDDFIENSRLMIFETFCRIHQCISISMGAEKLNMGTEEAERWIVNLIRNAKLDAKIDSQLGHVVMGTQTTSPYEQLIERTKALSFRSQMLQLNVEKKKKAQDQPNWGTDGF